MKPITENLVEASSREILIALKIESSNGMYTLTRLRDIILPNLMSGEMNVNDNKL